MPNTPSVGILLFLASCLAASSQAPAPTSSGENAFVEAQANSMGLKAELHTVDPAPDGAHELGIGGLPGHYWFTTPGAVALMPDGSIDRAHSSPFTTVQEADFHGFYCRAGAIVIAKDIGSSTRMTTSGRLIYAKTHFSVTQILKPGLEVVQGSDLPILTLGGTVTDQGETFTIRLYGGVPFAEGGLYLLALRRDAALAAGEYMLDPKETISIQDSHIHPLGLTVKQFFEPGEPLTALTRQWTQLVADVPCPHRP